MATDAPEFEAHREHLFAVAYRLLGTVGDAEDVVQEAYLRWRRGERGEVESPRAYLTTVVTRLGVDRLRSLQSRREEYVGPWLPEPLLTDEPADREAELSDSISMAFLVLLERLSPLERAVFLLHEVFGYSHDEVARVVERRPDHCRQLLKRARERIGAERPRFAATPADQERIAARFLESLRTGDLATLVALLQEDITLWSDGGGRVAAALVPIRGRDKVLRFLGAILQKAGGAWTSVPHTVNGQPGFLNHLDGQLDSITVLDVAGGRIVGIRIVRNPEKLARLRPGS